MSILYSQTASPEEVQSRFRLKNAGNIPAFKPNLFVQSNTAASVITVDIDHKRKRDIGHWGLMSSAGECIASLAGPDIPKWHTMMEPPRRCMIPATSFAVGHYPIWFCIEDDLPFSLFSMAGVLFQRSGKLNFLMITVPSNRVVQPYSESMPLILKPDEYACWLHAPWDFASELIGSQDGEKVRAEATHVLARTG